MSWSGGKATNINTPNNSGGLANAGLNQDELNAQSEVVQSFIDSGEEDKAYAAIKRFQWNNFEENDKPYILDYTNQITSDKYIDRAVGQAATGVNEGFSLERSNKNRRDQALGLEMSQRVKANSQADTDRAHAAAMVDTMNNAEVAARDRQTALIAGTNLPERT